MPSSLELSLELSMINYVESVELIETVVTECSRERVLLVKLECILGWHTGYHPLNGIHWIAVCDSSVSNWSRTGGMLPNAPAKSRRKRMNSPYSCGQRLNGGPPNDEHKNSMHSEWVWQKFEAAEEEKVSGSEARGVTVREIVCETFRVTIRAPSK